MNILCISKDLSGSDLFYRLKKEGHNVRVFVDEKEQQENLIGMVESTKNWKRDVKKWVGNEGLIIFDSIGYGKLQDKLRKKGYSVIGGCEMGDKLEHDRQYGQKVLSLHGVNVVPSTSFRNLKKAIKFVQENEGPWVVKQNGHASKIFNYVGNMEDGSDVISLLENYSCNNRKECGDIDIQKKITGVEIGAGRYFNGNDWVGPIEMNMEHKNLCNGDVGPKTFEMGTLTWYDENDAQNRLFQETLAKLKPYLKEIDFRGDAEINCIINETGVYPLEMTTRFGWPATQLQDEIHLSPWGEFLKAVADGKPYDLKYKKGYGIVALVATPPFPYDVQCHCYSPKGMKISFAKDITEEDMEHIHFEEVSMRKNYEKDGYYISGNSGFILHVGGVGNSIGEAREKVYSLIKKIIIPKMFYRTDIGQKFVEEDEKKLREWGWL